MLTVLAPRAAGLNGTSWRPTVKKWINWGLIAFGVYLIVQFPDDATRMLTNTRDLLGRVAESGADFVGGFFGQ
jgi:hypothetical protein